MKLEQALIDQIRTAFEKMQSREDLLHLLNEAKPLVYGEKAIPFELKQLTRYANPKLGRKRYSAFKIKKKAGTDRTIHAPVKGLKSLQKTLSFILQCVYEPHNAAMGFVRDKSIVDNARLHAGRKYVYNIDLKDFFSSIDQARVWKCLQLKPFNLNKETSAEHQYMKWEDFKKDYLKTDKPITFLKGKGRMVTSTPYGTIYMANNFDKTKDKYILLGGSSLKTKGGKSLEGTLWLVNKIPDSSRQNIANIIASLCCTEMAVERKNEASEWEVVKRNVLPQGAPTSPVLTNIVCQRLDFILSGVAKRFGLKYSRYADDITFSSMHNVYQLDGEFLKELHRIIAEQGFHIKESKTRLQKDGYRKEVTGLLVNEKANVQHRYIKQLRMWLYYWERYGYDRAYGFFLQQYLADKGNIVKGKPDIANVIGGKLDYLKMVKGAESELYLKLKARLDILTDKIKPDTEDVEKTEKNEDRQSVMMSAYNNFAEVVAENPDEFEGTLNEEEIKALKKGKLFSKKKSERLPEPAKLFDEEEENKPGWLFPHNPLYTIAFLKKFKIGDGSGFKELVHDVILTDESIQDIMNKVKSHPNFIKHYKKEKVTNVSYLNRGIIFETRKLIDLFEKEGIPFYNSSHKHPFNNDNEYTNYAKNFKRKYRYGSGSEYSKLQSDIINIFNDQHVSVSSLSFMPDERKFNIRSSFFTWQPSIYNGIRYIIQGICDHSNINGVRPFNPMEKKILIEVERVQGELLTFVELRIFDYASVAKIDSKTLLHFLQGSAPYKFDFRNLCDWIVECDFTDESSKRLNLLVAPESSDTSEEVKELKSPVGGFKHILRFYDVK